MGEPGGCRLWGRTESDTTEATWQQHMVFTFLCLAFLPSIVSSRSMHVVANVRISLFLWLSNSLLYTCVYVCVCIYTHTLYIHTHTKGFPGGSAMKNPPANAGDTGLIPGSGRSPGAEHGNPFQCSCLGKPMDGGAWWAAVHRVTKE